MDVKFDDEINVSRPTRNVPKGLTAWFINNGLAKDAQQASTFMLVAAAIFLVLSLIIYSTTGTKTPKYDPAVDADVDKV